MAKSLKERLLQCMENGLPFMEDKEKGEQILNEEIKINQYGFLTGDDGEFIAYTIEGNDNEFFFGGYVLTERFKKIENTFTEEEIQELLEEGISVKLLEVKSKNKRKYIGVEFI